MDWPDRFSVFSIFGLLAGFRDTLFGYLIYKEYLQQEAPKSSQDFKLQIMQKIYLLDVIWMPEEIFDQITEALDAVHEKFADILNKWINIDDNKGYFKIWMQDWLAFIQEKSDNRVFLDVGWEDVIWFRWFLKNITFYNKRYIIPKE